MTTRRTLLTAFLGAGLAACKTTRIADLPVVSFANARWFDGTSFAAKQGWSVEGRFTFRRPARVDAALDLAGA